MCAISGIYALNAQNLGQNLLGQEVRQILATMLAVQAHRGPDAQGIAECQNVAFGHCRLSIIDLAGGAQPMWDKNQQCLLVCNGEIYNYRELKQELMTKGHQFQTQSDSEVILLAYLEWGVNCLAKLEGMFAFALWDSRDASLFCARDRFGKKPFFYTLQNDCFYFASSLQALCLNGLKRELDLTALFNFLAYDYVPCPKTPWQNFFALEAASYLLIKNGQVSKVNYWQPPLPETTQKSEAELAEELRFLLRQAVKRRLVSDVPLGVFLSGGIDSSIVTALMAEQSNLVQTFSIGFTEASYDESSYSRIVAKHFQTKHHEEILSAEICAEILPLAIEHLDLPLADASVAPTWLLSEITKKSVTVALGGDGADELFAGYEHYIGFNLAEYYNKLPNLLRTKILEPLCKILPTSSGYINPRLAVATFLKGAKCPQWLRIQSLLTSFSSEAQREILANSEQFDLSDSTIFASTKNLYEYWQKALPLERTFFVYLRQFLLDDILVKVDRCSMRHALEVRAPFLDRDFAEFVCRLPVKFKLHWGLQRKYLLKKAFVGILPEAISKRNKRGFQIPVADWLRTKLAPLLQDLLSPSYLAEQGIFKVAPIQNLIQQHLEHKADLRKQLWNLLVWQIWHKSHQKNIN